MNGTTVINPSVIVEITEDDLPPLDLLERHDDFFMKELIDRLTPDIINVFPFIQFLEDKHNGPSQHRIAIEIEGYIMDVLLNDFELLTSKGIIISIKKAYNTFRYPKNDYATKYSYNKDLIIQLFTKIEDVYKEPIWPEWWSQIELFKSNL